MSNDRNCSPVKNSKWNFHSTFSKSNFRVYLCRKWQRNNLSNDRWCVKSIGDERKLRASLAAESRRRIEKKKKNGPRSRNKEKTDTKQRVRRPSPLPADRFFPCTRRQYRIRHYLETIETLSRRSTISGSFFLSSTLGEAKLKAFLTLSRTLCPVVCVWSTIVVLLYTSSPKSPNDLYEAPIPAGMAAITYFLLAVARPRWKCPLRTVLFGRLRQGWSCPPCFGGSTSHFFADTRSSLVGCCCYRCSVVDDGWYACPKPRYANIVRQQGKRTGKRANKESPR